MLYICSNTSIVLYLISERICSFMDGERCNHSGTSLEIRLGLLLAVSAKDQLKKPCCLQNRKAHAGLEGNSQTTVFGLQNLLSHQVVTPLNQCTQTGELADLC